MSVEVTDGDPFTIAIVGMGPRGLSVLERLVIRLGERVLDRPVRIFAIDPGEPGAGRIWRTDQPEWLIMNTPAGEVSLYSGEPDDGPARAGAGPSLERWLRGHPDRRWAATGPNGYAPRAIYGEYLRSVYRAVTAHLPHGVTVEAVRARVTRARRDGEEYLLFLDRRSTALAAHRVVLTTGHPRNVPGRMDREFQDFAAPRAGLRYLRGDSVADLDLTPVRAGETIGVIGMGLSFYDIVSCLTEGRGGQFTVDDVGGLRYQPSGAEPHIVAGSRSGLPLPARGRNQKSPYYRYRPTFLTDAAVAAARARRVAERGSPQLDFRQDLLPLLQIEIEHMYYTTSVRRRQSDQMADLFAKRNLAIGADASARADLMREFGLDDLEPLDLVRLARPFTARRFADPADFHRQLLELLRADVAEAELGNVDGPLKAALDIMRDIRGVTRPAIDFSGLLPSSQRDDFLTWFNPMNALLSAGPPANRVAQLCALMASGIVTVVGPDTRYATDPEAGLFAVWSPQVAGSRRLATTLIDARIPRTDLRRDASSLTRQLLHDGLISEYVNTDPVDGDVFHTGGLAVTTAPFHVVDGFGRATPGLYALGIPTENTRWFTQIGNGRPGPVGAFHGDADAIAVDALAPVGARTPILAGREAGSAAR
jgi:hypothetical protein